MVKSYGVGGWVGGLLDYTVSLLGQVIAIVISRPRSLTIKYFPHLASKSQTEPDFGLRFAPSR